MKPVIFGSRGSALALAQTRLIITQLQEIWPDRTFDLRIIKTKGDGLSEDPSRALNQPLGKGLFTAELEQALFAGEIDLAVHSLKDLPTADTAGLILAAIPERADARDVLITREEAALDALPPGAVIATGSPRRSAQLRRARSDLQTELIRGNIDTRLRKFREKPGLSALVLAAAGLERLQPDVGGLTVVPLPFSIMLPAPGQGALALQAREDADEVHKIARELHHMATSFEVACERAFLQALGGGCLEPIAAYAVTTDAGIALEGIAWLKGETEPRHGKKIAFPSSPEELGRALAEEISR